MCRRPAPERAHAFDRWPATWLGQHVGEELGFGLHVRTPATEMQRALAAWDLAELSLSDAPEGLNRLQAVRLSLAAMSLAAPTLALLDNPTACCASRMPDVWAMTSPTGRKRPD